MGYRPEGKVYRLTFTDPAMAGLEIDAKSMPVGKLMDLIALAQVIDTADMAAMVEPVQKLFCTFSAALIKWNLEDDDGNPVPTTVEGLYSQDLDFILGLFVVWLETVAGVSAPLGAGSDSGAQSLGESIPMEPLSPSLAS